MSLEVYAHPVSQPSRAVLWFLAITNTEHNFHFMDFLNGACQTPEMLALTPQGQVPFMTHGELQLTEGAAMLQYIAQSNGLSDWYPTEPVAAARVNQVLHWHHSNLRRVTGSHYLPWVLRAIGRSEDAPPTRAACLEALTKSLTRMEAWLGEGAFVARTEQPTIADIWLYCEIDEWDYVNIDFSGFPNVQRWIAAMKELPAHDSAREPLAEFSQLLNKTADDAAASE